MEEFQVVVIGSGTAGQTAAYDLNEKGLRVALVERSGRPGGTCAQYGCQPKKWFYEATETIARCRHLEGKGIEGIPRGAWPDVLREKNRFTSRVPEKTVEGLQKAGIAFFAGEARFTGPGTLRAGDTTLKGDYFLVATGARPMPLPMEGVEHMITSRDFLELENLPPRVIFVGGGFISFEFAHFAARLGPPHGEIHILEAAGRPLGPFDEEMVRLLVEASREEGIQVLTNVKITSIERKSSGVVVSTGSGDTFEGDMVVHGAGRAPDLEGLNLEAAGVKHSRRGIGVDASMRTSNERIFAVGDCAATVQLARVADEEGHTAAANILAELRGGPTAVMDYGAVPSMLFTCPQYGMVGKTEKSLQEEGIPYRKSFDKNLSWPTYRRVGMKHAAYKILAAEDGKVLGAHILSDNATGLLSMFRIAMVQKMTVDELHRTGIMTPYPSRESDLIYMLKPLLED